MREYENFCVGCETCVNCGRDEDVLVISCDICGNSHKQMYCYNNKDYCFDCLVEHYEFIQDFIDAYKDSFLDYIGAYEIDEIDERNIYDVYEIDDDI